MGGRHSIRTATETFREQIFYGTVILQTRRSNIPGPYYAILFFKSGKIFFKQPILLDLFEKIFYKIENPNNIFEIFNDFFAGQSYARRCFAMPVIKITIIIAESQFIGKRVKYR